jgi:hypothetical protein
MPTADGKFTVAEYQEMIRTNNIQSGVVDLLPRFDAPIKAQTSYLTCDGGSVFIVGEASDPDFMYSRGGYWYHRATGRVRLASGFLDISADISAETPE